MSEAIQVLVDLASNATLDNQENITTMLAEAEISLEQEQAIVAKDVEKLADSINLTEIRAFVPVLPAEDDNGDEDSENDDNENDDASNLAVAF